MPSEKVSRLSPSVFCFDCVWKRRRRGYSLTRAHYQCWCVLPRKRDSTHNAKKNQRLESSQPQKNVSHSSKSGALTPFERLSRCFFSKNRHVRSCCSRPIVGNCSCARRVICSASTLFWREVSVPHAPHTSLLLDRRLQPCTSQLQEAARHPVTLRPRRTHQKTL